MSKFQLDWLISLKLANDRTFWQKKTAFRNVDLLNLCNIDLNPHGTRKRTLILYSF